MIKLEVFGPGWLQNFILFKPNQEKFEFCKNISANRLSWSMEMNIEVGILSLGQACSSVALLVTM